MTKKKISRVRRITGTHYYCGRKLQLEVTNSGFTLWEVSEGRWVLDASCADEGGGMEVSGDVKQHWSPKGSSRHFDLFRPISKRWRVAAARQKAKTK